MPQTFYIGLDFGRHEELLADDGLVHIPIGCFLLRSGGSTVLIDAGLGDVDVGWGRGGELPGALRAAGASPEDIDVVVCSHLHIDHIGWLVVDDVPYFPNAVVRYGAADWQRFVAGADADDRGRQIMEVLAAAGRLEPLDGDMLRIAPGLTSAPYAWAHAWPLRACRLVGPGPCRAPRRCRGVPAATGGTRFPYLVGRGPRFGGPDARSPVARARRHKRRSHGRSLSRFAVRSCTGRHGQALVLTCELTRWRCQPRRALRRPRHPAYRGPGEPTTVTG